jgi:DNA-binding MarR family transcriptional regulator
LRTERTLLDRAEDGLKVANLPPLAWYDVLFELERCGGEGLRPAQLQKELMLAQYNLSRLLDRIEAGGYVARRLCHEDGRGQVVTITTDGRRMLRRMWVVYSSVIQGSIGERLEPAETASLIALLGKIA